MSFADMRLRKIDQVSPSSDFLAWITKQSTKLIRYCEKSQFKTKSSWPLHFLKSPAHSELFLLDVVVLH